MEEQRAKPYLVSHGQNQNAQDKTRKDEERAQGQKINAAGGKTGQPAREFGIGVPSLHTKHGAKEPSPFLIRRER